MTRDSKAVSRRGFLKYAAVVGSAFIAALVGLGLLSRRSEVTPPEEFADTIFKNGNILTVDSNDSIVEAAAIKDGRILATGSYRELKGMRGSSTREIDLRGKTVTPGLVDSHIHVHYYGKQFDDRLMDIRFPTVRTVDDLIEKVKERANVVEKGEWVAGNQGFNFYTEVPDRWQLDEIAPDNPVFLLHASGQFAVANSMALELAGINRDTPNPYSAVIDKDSAGEPTGFLYHYPAINMVRRLVPGIGVVTEQDEKQYIAIGSQKSLEAGYTSCQDVIISQPEHVQRYIDMDKEKQLPIHIYMLLYVSSYEDAENRLKIMDHWKGDNYVFAGWKIAVDGGPSAGTILMYDKDTPISHRSYLYHTQEVLNEMVSMFHKEGYQVSFHVGGDQAIDMALDAIEYALQKTPREDHRHRLEHVLFPTPEALERIKRLGVIVSTQPQWITLYGKGWKENMTDEQAKRFMPLRTMLDKEIKLAFGCDVPATAFIEPRYAFIGATTRMTLEKQPLLPEESISMKKALRAHTMGSAYAAFEEDVKGSIEPGKKADLVIWSHDLYSASLGDLWNMGVEATVVGGEVVYKSEKTELDL